MKVYRKEADQIQVISFPEEPVEKGDYLLIEDSREDRGLLAQVIDIQYANIPGILEDLLREVTTEENLVGEDYDPLDVSSHIHLLKDTRMLICKIRGSLQDGRLVQTAAWTPSRTGSKITRVTVETLINFNKPRRPILAGETKKGTPILLDACDLDGRLNIITGKKGTGKSHLAKLFVLGLVDQGAPCLVFDVNGEYVNLNRLRKGGFSRYRHNLEVLTPRLNLRFTLAQLGLRTVQNILNFALDLPSTSSKVFSSIWHELECHGTITIQSLGNLIQTWNCHEQVREALWTRYNTIHDSGIFTDYREDAVDLERVSMKIDKGGAIVVDMKNLSQTSRRILVEIFLGKFREILALGKLRALFLFAEEAHLYLRETYWDDIVTRMRHIGLFSTFITNQPDTIQETIYRQADNIFLFNFTNDRDLEAVAKASRIDADSVRLLVRDMPPRQCLAIGDAVHNFPIVLGVKPLDVETMGETRLFFAETQTVAQLTG